jgi:type II secretory pathway predicted ATPase ExeA
MDWGRFGCREAPFTAGFDVRFVYLPPSQQKVYENIRRRIVEHGGLSIITGQSGTGKTSLLFKLIVDLKESIPTSWFFSSPAPTIESLVDRCRELAGLAAVDASQGSTFTPEDFLTALVSGQRVVLIIDEAQSLTDEVLHFLIELTESGKDLARGLSIVLAGQPTLEDRINTAPLRSLADTVGFRYRIPSLALAHVKPFILHRLRVAGFQQSNPVSAEAIERIAIYSKGIHRHIVDLCGLAFYFASERSETQITVESVELAASGMFLDAGEDARRQFRKTSVLKTSFEKSQSISNRAIVLSSELTVPSFEAPMMLEALTNPEVQTGERAARTINIGKDVIRLASGFRWAWPTAAFAMLLLVGNLAWTLLYPQHDASLDRSVDRGDDSDGVSASLARLMQSFNNRLIEPRLPKSEQMHSLEFALTAGSMGGLGGAAEASSGQRKDGGWAVLKGAPGMTSLAHESDEKIKTIAGFDSNRHEILAVTSSEIQLLLASAENHFNADRLVAPRFENALELYRKVLVLDPENSVALAGLAAIRTKLTSFAREEAARGDIASANSQLRKIQLLNKAH